MYSVKRLQIIGAVGLVVAAGVFGITQFSQQKDKTEEVVPMKRAVTALGRLTPRGGNVQLAVPAGVTGGNEIITEWLVDEGDRISKGQELAFLSSYQQLRTEVKTAEENLRLSLSLLPFLEVSQTKAKKLLVRGSLSQEEYSRSVSALKTKQSEVLSNQTALQRAKNNLQSSVVRSPLNGRLVKIYSWPGMKATSDGLALAARTSDMQVWAQVFQTDINRIQQGQMASIAAESGGFKGNLNAKVRSIIGEVSERDLFAVSGSNDINARVILVKLDLTPEDRAKVEQLSGLNVTVTFEDEA